MRSIAFIVALSSFAPEAAAQGSGSVSGHVTVQDFRRNPYRDLSDIVSVLRSYPDDCPCGVNSNRCANEGYVFDPGCAHVDIDGSNWKDFRWNYVGLFGQAAEMDGIEAWNGLSAQTED